MAITEETAISHAYDDTGKTISKGDYWYQAYVVVHRRSNPTERMAGMNAIKVHTLRVDLEDEESVNKILSQFPSDPELQSLDEDAIEDADKILEGLSF